MTKLDFRLGPPLGYRAKFGLIVLRTDETVEAEARQFLSVEGIAHYVTRVPCQTEVTMDALAEMEAEIPRAASLLPATHQYDVVAYACTSGATSIGPDRVAAAVHSGISTRLVTDPLTASIAAAKALGVRRIGFVTPYMPDVTGAMRGKLEDAGLDIVACGSMEEESDERVACIDQQSIRQAVLTIGRSAPCDAVFLACTNLRGLPVIQDMESELGTPVLTSNQVLLWHMMSLAGVSTAHLPFGALMRCS